MRRIKCRFKFLKGDQRAGINVCYFKNACRCYGCSCHFYWKSLPYLSRSMTKTKTKWHARLVKTQISLGIRPVWSESLLSGEEALAPCFVTHWVQSEDWLDWADVQADLSLRWVQTSFRWFSHDMVHFLSYILFFCDCFTTEVKFITPKDIPIGTIKIYEIMAFIK